MLENENMIDLLGSLKEMSSDQLSRLIQEETAKEAPNDELVLTALDILEDREKESPMELGPKGKAAWKKYLSKVRARQRKTILIWKPMMQVASILLIITLLFALLPTPANAETWWERFARWTDDFFSFFNHNSSEIPEDKYVFQTDNEGLQQVYDAVVELGVTEPVVPMWVPEGYRLEEIKTDTLPRNQFIFSIFADESSQFCFQIRISEGDVPYLYHKDKTDVVIYEKQGITFHIINNNERKNVTWIVDNIECALSIDCQEEILYKIIDSIYRWRYNNEIFN